MVKFGSTNARSFAFRSSQKIVAVSPKQESPDTPIIGDVTVTNEKGETSPTTSFDKFRYISECAEGHAPAVTSLSPSSGEFGEAAKVLIKGERFSQVVCTSEPTSVERVFFGTQEARFKSGKHEGEIIAEAPGGYGGTVDVTVESPLVGQSPISPADRYAYERSGEHPHYFRNSGGAFSKATKVAEGVKVPIIEWGNIEYTAEGIPGTECNIVVGGFIENPKGGSAGRGATESFNAYNCKNGSCLAPDFESSQARNLNGQHETSTEGPLGSGNQVAWPWVLEEREAGVVRTDISNVSMLVGCRGETGHLVAGTFVECFTEPEDDEQTPKWQNGTGIGSRPSKVEFDEGSGSLNCSGAFKGKNGKSLKVMGYNEQEIIETGE